MSKIDVIARHPLTYALIGTLWAGAALRGHRAGPLFVAVPFLLLAFVVATQRLLTPEREPDPDLGEYGEFPGGV